MIRNLIAFIVLNIWLVSKRAGYVTCCPGCHNASCLNRFGMQHCDVCGYHRSVQQ